jgi:hypothetical protein
MMAPGNGLRLQETWKEIDKVSTVMEDWSELTGIPADFTLEIKLVNEKFVVIRTPKPLINVGIVCP